MIAVNKLLDTVRAVCSLNSDAELAERLDVSRQLVSQWRKGANPLSDDRVTELAQLCKDDPATWLVRVRAEQTKGAAAKAWSTLAKRLGAAAAVVLAVALPYGNAAASAGVPEQATACALCEVVRRWLRKAVTLPAARLAYGPAAVLA